MGEALPKTGKEMGYTGVHGLTYPHAPVGSKASDLIRNFLSCKDFRVYRGVGGPICPSPFPQETPELRHRVTP